MADFDLNEIVLKIRTTPTRFEQRIAGAAEFGSAHRETTRPNQAFVFPLGDEAEENTQDNGVQQLVRQTFAVVIVLDNSPDYRGQKGINAALSARSEIFKALINYNPTWARSCITYGAGRLIELNRARLWWQFEFRVDVQVTEADGTVEVFPDDFLLFNIKHFQNRLLTDEDGNTLIDPETGEVLGYDKQQIAEDHVKVRE